MRAACRSASLIASPSRSAHRVPLHNTRDVRETLSPFCRSFVAPVREIDSPSLARCGKRRLPARLPGAMSTTRAMPLDSSMHMDVSATDRARGWIVQRGPDTAPFIAISVPLPAQARPMWRLRDGRDAPCRESTENVSDVKRASGSGLNFAWGSTWGRVRDRALDDDRLRTLQRAQLFDGDVAADPMPAAGVDERRILLLADSAELARAACVEHAARRR
jgi:hypothetical protein